MGADEIVSARRGAGRPLATDPANPNGNGHEPAQVQADRLRRLAGQLRERELDWLLVATPVNLRYLTGFTGTHGLALIAAGERAGTGRHRFLTDFRYAEQSAEEVPNEFDREIVSGALIDAAARSLSGTSGRLGFDDATLTVAQHGRLQELLEDDWELVPFTHAIERLRAVKDAGELARIRAAAALADEAMRGLLESGVVGRTEREVAIELELRIRRLGAEAPSFPSIVAAGAHAALPHASPREEPIARDVLVTIDWGALHQGYCSDCTRTYATGNGISTEAGDVYQLVLSAQERALDAVRAGPSGRELDAVAREVIERAGYGGEFGHGLGHGVGMEVHEGPRLSRTGGEEPLLAGNVVTVEPGVYLPGRLAVRIEDLVVVGQSGHDVLTSLPKALMVIQ
jgi:Xaa-Pro aminopeptidase